MRTLFIYVYLRFFVDIKKTKLNALIKIKMSVLYVMDIQKRGQ